MTDGAMERERIPEASRADPETRDLILEYREAVEHMKETGQTHLYNEAYHDLLGHVSDLLDRIEELEAAARLEGEEVVAYVTPEELKRAQEKPGHVDYSIKVNSSPIKRRGQTIPILVRRREGE